MLQRGVLGGGATHRERSGAPRLTEATASKKDPKAWLVKESRLLRRITKGRVEDLGRAGGGECKTKDWKKKLL